MLTRNQAQKLKLSKEEADKAEKTVFLQQTHIIQLK